MASLVEVLGDKSNVKTRGRSFLKSSPNNKLSLHWDNVHSFFVCFEDRMTSFQRAKLHITTCYWLFFFFFFFYSTWELLISWFSSSKIVFISSTETSSAPNWSAQCCLCCNLWFLCDPFVLQASFNSSSITTRVAAYTGCELWGRGISWTSQWVRCKLFLVIVILNVWTLEPSARPCLEEIRVKVRDEDSC